MIRYNKILEEHPVDLQILGIGRNGHIGFNGARGHPLIVRPNLVQLDDLPTTFGGQFPLSLVRIDEAAHEKRRGQRFQRLSRSMAH